MQSDYTWILFLMLPCALVWSLPVQVPLFDVRSSDIHVTHAPYNHEAQNIPKQEASNTDDEKVISVRITSSVAVGRGDGKKNKLYDQSSSEDQPAIGTTNSTTAENNESAAETAELAGANLEFIKQLHSRKEARGLNQFEKIHSFELIRSDYSNETDDSVADSSIPSVFQVENKEEENIPLARSVPLSASPHNYIQGLSQKPLGERGNSPTLTNVEFNLMHVTPKATSNNYNEPSDTFISPGQMLTSPPKFYVPPKIFNEPSKVYSQPAQVYSEPAKFYSEPAKIYSEPAKVYSEPSKVYSEPAKIYSEPARFYSQPASLHLPPASAPSLTTWHAQSHSPAGTTVQLPSTSTPATVTKSSLPGTHRVDQHPEKNYEVDEKVSVQTDGRSHGVQVDSSNPENCKQENCKVGYVVEGRQYRKYRVEERTSDGFIVGEYGVVRNEDGALRGVRYTADGDASPRLIYDALMKFLQL